MNAKAAGWALALALSCTAAASAATGEAWDKDVGNDAPKLIAAGWVGTPVSLEAVKGNTVVLAFWNGDIPC